MAERYGCTAGFGPPFRVCVYINTEQMYLSIVGTSVFHEFFGTPAQGHATGHVPDVTRRKSWYRPAPRNATTGKVSTQP